MNTELLRKAAQDLGACLKSVLREEAASSVANKTAPETEKGKVGS